MDKLLFCVTLPRHVVIPIAERTTKVVVTSSSSFAMITLEGSWSHRVAYCFVRFFKENYASPFYFSYKSREFLSANPTGSREHKEL